MRSLGSLLASSVAVFAIQSRPVLADVLTVGPSGSGASFTEIQPAIDAAQPGDTVLVAAGNYAPFVLDKALSVIGAGSTSTSVVAPSIAGADTAAIEVRGLAQGSVATIAGMLALGSFADVDTPAASILGLVQLVDNAGQVILHGVAARLVPAAGSPAAQDFALNIANCALVQVSEGEYLDGRPSARIEGSQVWLNGTTIVGCQPPVYMSGLACELIESTLYLSRTSIQGGKGSWYITDFFGSPATTPGGVGVKCSNSTLKRVGGPGAEIRGGNGGSYYDDTLYSSIGGHGLHLTQSSIALVAPHMALHAGPPIQINIPWSPFPQQAFPIHKSNSTVHEVATLPIDPLEEPERRSRSIRDSFDRRQQVGLRRVRTLDGSRIARGLARRRRSDDPPVERAAQRVRVPHGCDGCGQPHIPRPGLAGADRSRPLRPGSRARPGATRVLQPGLHRDPVRERPSRSPVRLSRLRGPWVASGRRRQGLVVALDIRRGGRSNPRIELATALVVPSRLGRGGLARECSETNHVAALPRGRNACMGLTLVSGTVSLTRERKDVSGTTDNITTLTTTEFRIGNRPANFKAGINLSPGDQVRAAGNEGAELDVLALANDTTSVQYTTPCPQLWMIAFLLLLPFIGIGLALQGDHGLGGLLFLMGLASFPMGLVLCWKRSRIMAAVRLLSSAASSR